MFPDTPKNRAAARKIQQWARGHLTRLALRLKVTVVGKGIVSTQLAMQQPSLLLGEAAQSLDLHKKHEVMVTRIISSEVDLLLTTNQGTPDGFKRHLRETRSDYGVIINGGFYAMNGFYHLKSNSPIGLHRFRFNSTFSKHLDVITQDVENTAHFFNHTEDDCSTPVKGYEPEKGICSQLHLRTQTPYSVKDYYGYCRISRQGAIDIQKSASLTNEQSFTDYIANAEYLLSSGPMLVWDNQVLITEQLCQADQRFQFKKIHEHFGMSPGSVPPGTFYHADQLNPRSAIGLTAKGELLMVTVKGKEDPNKRDGMTLDQMALLMKLLGAQTALNLDGGYSACQGVFNQSKMVMPHFIKKAGRNALIPYGIVAKEKSCHLAGPSEEPVPKRPRTELQNASVRKTLFQ